MYANAPFKHLDFSGPTAKSVFESFGAQITADITMADGVVLLDIDQSTIDQVIKFDIPRKKCVLIRNEPLCVLPENYKSSSLDRIGFIVESGASVAKNGIILKRGQHWPKGFEEVAQSNKINRIVVVNSNQLSLLDGELYSLRRECVHEIEQVDLFGMGWDIGFRQKFLITLYHLLKCFRCRLRPNFRSLRFYFKKPKNYGGVIDNKLVEMAKYKYALVVENSMQHLTEKLFDAFFAQCIPIYVGPRVADYGIPSDLVIQAEPTLSGVRDAMKRASEVDQSLWLESLDLWPQGHPH